MVNFHTVFDEAPDLNTAEAIRSTLHTAYDRYHDLWTARERPPGTSVHHLALYGVLTCYYENTGTSPWTVARHEWLFWLDLLPFLHLPEEEGLDALIEYILWKEPHTREQARQSWLIDQIQEGLINAVMAGEKERVAEATDIEGIGALPWVGLVAGRFQLPSG